MKRKSDNRLCDINKKKIDETTNIRFTFFILYFIIYIVVCGGG